MDRRTATEQRRDSTGSRQLQRSAPSCVRLLSAPSFDEAAPHAGGFLRPALQPAHIIHHFRNLQFHLRHGVPSRNNTGGDNNCKRKGPCPERRWPASKDTEALQIRDPFKSNAMRPGSRCPGPAGPDRTSREFAAGKSPRSIALDLNRERIPGPFGDAWGDTTIRGHACRGTGVLNNELTSASWSGTACATSRTRTPESASPGAIPRRNGSGRRFPSGASLTTRSGRL